jgi:hypothetical protein
MRTRVQDVVAFATIFGTFYAGILHLAWWAALAGACALALISIHNHRVAYRASGGTGAPAVVLLLSLAKCDHGGDRGTGSRSRDCLGRGCLAIGILAPNSGGAIFCDANWSESMRRVDCES